MRKFTNRADELKMSEKISENSQLDGNINQCETLRPPKTNPTSGKTEEE